MAFYALISVVFIAVFSLVMAAYASQRELRSRRDLLRRRLGAPEGAAGLYDDARGKLAVFLTESGLGWAPRLFVSRSLTAAAAGALIGVIVGGPGTALLGGVGGLLFFPLWVAGKRSERLSRCDEQLPQALQIMILALRAGHALPGALALGAREAPEPVRSELRRAVDEHALGRPLGEVVGNFARRLPSSDTAQTFAVAVLVLEQTGGNLINVLDRIVDNARMRTQYKAKLRALTTQGRWSAWILCGMPFVFGILAAYLDPNYLPALMESKGIILLFFGLWIPGLLWTVRLVRSAGASS